MKVNKNALITTMKELYGFYIEVEVDDESDANNRAYKCRVKLPDDVKVGFHRSYDLTEAVNCAVLKALNHEIPWEK